MKDSAIVALHSCSRSAESQSDLVHWAYGPKKTLKRKKREREGKYIPLAIYDTIKPEPLDVTGLLQRLSAWVPSQREIGHSETLDHGTLSRYF